MKNKKVLIPVISVLNVIVIAIAILVVLNGKGIIGNKTIKDASVLNHEESEAISNDLPIVTTADNSTQTTATMLTSVVTSTTTSGKSQSESSTAKKKEKNYNGYRKLLAKAFDSYGEYCEYSVYDLNNDGINELIIKAGTCEADFKYHFYTLDKNMSAKEVGTFDGFHSTMYANEEKAGVYTVSTYGVDGNTYNQKVTSINLTDGILHTETIIDEDKSMDEKEFSNSSPLSICYVNDASLLEKGAKLIGEMPEY